jgi:hypothetical protein
MKPLHMGHCHPERSRGISSWHGGAHTETARRTEIPPSAGRRNDSAFRGIAALLVILALAACKGEEMGRQIKLDKGTYAGPMDSEITPPIREALRQRIASQSDGIARLATDGPIPTGEATLSGRITGQRF